MIEIHKMHIEDIKDIYPAIYKQVFDETDDFQCPSVVYLWFKNGEFKGFLSGYVHNLVTFYLQYTGIVREKRGYGTLEMFRAGIKEIDKEFPSIMTVIKNDNIVAIKMALQVHFIPHGIRQDTKGQLYLELIRKRENVTF